MSTVYDRRLDDKWIENYADVDYLVVGGGSGGNAGRSGGSTGGGGGGAGGLVNSFCNPGTASLLTQWGTYAVTVGGGGTAGPGPGTATPASCAGGGAGNNSVFSTITACGS